MLWSNACTIYFDDSANESKLFGPTWQELKGRLKNLGRDNINGDSGNSNKEDSTRRQESLLDARIQKRLPQSLRPQVDHRDRRPQREQQR